MARPSLMPLPAKVAWQPGTFTLTTATTVLACEAALPATALLVEDLARTVGAPLRVTAAARPAPGAGSIVFLAAEGKPLPAESYDLQVQPDRILIHAADAAGMFYACQTLRQLLPPAGAAPLGIPCVGITDRPRFPWRGYLLDSSRHFQRKEFMLRFIDALASCKINRLHWHLMDNEGWRVELRKYPQLNGPAADVDPRGYHTQAELREIIAHAAARHVSIYPEIEMPGHSRWPVSVLPELRCAGAEGPAYEICLGADYTGRLFRDVLDEVMGIFPGEMLHLGGDEADDKHWRACSRCQARMQREGLANPRLLQKSFMAEMAAHVHRAGRRTIAWADHQDLGWPPGQIVQGWHRGESEYAIAHGLPTVHSVHEHTYFDYPNGADDPVRATWMPELPTQLVYAFDPVPAGATPEQAALVLGSEACLWTERVTENLVWPKTFPRLLAFAEVVWSPQAARQWPEFESRLARHRAPPAP